MNEKPVKVPMDFDEALRRIAKTPKGLIAPEKEVKKKPTSKGKKNPPERV